MKLKYILSLILIIATTVESSAQSVFTDKLLRENQKEFVNLDFGMFIHYGMPTFMGQDWSDPDASLKLFKSLKLDLRSTGANNQDNHDEAIIRGHYNRSGRDKQSNFMEILQTLLKLF